MRSPLDNPDFSGEAASVLGLMLGQSEAEARALVEANPQLVYHPDESNFGRFYVDDASGPAGDHALFYCQWPDGRPDMGHLVIYGRAARLLAHGFDRLVGAASYEAMEPEVKVWLGLPDRSVVTLDVGMIGLKHTNHVFERRGIEVIDVVASGDAPRVYIVLSKPSLMVRSP